MDGMGNFSLRALSDTIGSSPSDDNAKDRALPVSFMDALVKLPRTWIGKVGLLGVAQCKQVEFLDIQIASTRKKVLSVSPLESGSP